MPEKEQIEPADDEVRGSVDKHNDEDDVNDGTKEEMDGEAPNEQTGSKRKRKRKRKKKSKDETADDDNEAEDDHQQQDHDHSASVDCTVYVEGIPFDASPDDVKEFFESHGSITDILELRLPTWQDSGRLRGYGHVHFASKSSYDKALTLSGKHMGRRYLTIQPSQAPRGYGGSRNSSSHPDPNQPPPENCKTLFVNNLPYSAGEEEIETIFAKTCGGEIAGVRIARNSVNRQSKGFCYIEFNTPQDAQNVVKASVKKRIMVGGRPVRIDYDTGRMKGSFRSESGRLWTKEAKEQQQQGSGGKRQRKM